MKRVTFFLVLLLGALLLPRMTQAQFTIEFDENGSATLTTAAGTAPLAGALLADPSNGGNPALTYFLPFPVIAGDILVYDDAAHTDLSDVVRFTNENGIISGLPADRLIFYSLDIGGGALADTGAPANAGKGSVVAVLEATDGRFSYDSGDNHYRGISNEEVPDAGATALLLLGSACSVIGTASLRRRSSR
jgi:hypothetical protein